MNREQRRAQRRAHVHAAKNSQPAQVGIRIQANAAGVRMSFDRNIGYLQMSAVDALQIAAAIVQSAQLSSMPASSTKTKGSENVTIAPDVGESAGETETPKHAD